MKFVYYLFVIFQAGWLLVSASPVEFDLLMPNVAPKTRDMYLCHKMKLDQANPVYITEFEAKASSGVAHHILLYGCAGVSDEETWDCGEMSSTTAGSEYKTGPVCKGGSNIVFAWALDAPKLHLPDNVAFKLGGDSGINYLVLQVHYANVDKFINGGTDNSGLILKGQTEPTANSAGVYLMGTGGSILPGKTEHFEAACRIMESKTIYPFAFRAHAHKLGLVNSGYVIKTDPKTGREEWIELGRRSPQLPQMFYPVTNKVPVNQGDIMAARCTMKNFRNHEVRIGRTGADEMCNFYVMYYVKGNNLLNNNQCWSPGPPFFYWSESGLNPSQVPKDASVVPDEQQEQLSDTSMNNHHYMNHGGMDKHPALEKTEARLSEKMMAVLDQLRQQQIEKNDDDDDSSSSEEQDWWRSQDRYEQDLNMLGRQKAKAGPRRAFRK